ncbi:hypothetical protein [Arthrobacter antioxidans]|uniref:hypothetical protein n=1 Tax=Arthrobacter antioxidans TaxID=2895818 RepID=UPI0020003AE0|nr:hypothetical protein [Arthrobacter antioxidans]
MQHDDTLMAMEFAGLSVYETWMHYCNVGGGIDYFEFDAYLHGVLGLDAEDADVVSQAVNELIDDVLPAEESRGKRAPYSWTGCPVPAPADRGDDGPVHAPSMSPGIPLPPGAPLELLDEILGSSVLNPSVAGGWA